MKVLMCVFNECVVKCNKWKKLFYHRNKFFLLLVVITLNSTFAVDSFISRLPFLRRISKSQNFPLNSG